MSDLPAIKYLDMAARAAGFGNWADINGTAFAASRKSIIAHARTLEALAKYEPEPVAVDPDTQAVYHILNAYHRAPLDEVWHPAHEGVMAALAQYKAERPTITDDEALLIAREICARVADDLRQPGNARAYRDRHYDVGTDVQFALAMVKRDPAALEAFRGVGK